MKGVHLRFYTCENRHHHGVPVYQWLLDQAQKLGIPGGSAFKAMAGYGRNEKLHEQHFFELAGEVPVLVEFIADEDDARRLLERLAAERLALFHACLPTEYGIVGETLQSP